MAGTSQIQNLWLKVFIHIFHKVGIHQYFKLCPGGEGEYHRWLPIVAAARLSEEIPEVEEWLIAQVEKGL